VHRGAPTHQGPHHPLPAEDLPDKVLHHAVLQGDHIPFRCQVIVYLPGGPFHAGRFHRQVDGVKGPFHLIQVHVSRCRDGPLPLRRRNDEAVGVHRPADLLVVGDNGEVMPGPEQSTGDHAPNATTTHQ
jgi:hypothetical protein